MKRPNWFYVSSINVSVNLDCINYICWDESKHSEHGDATRLFNAFDPSDWVLITDFNDRVKLRAILVGDGWQPSKWIDQTDSDV